ncbi:MAG TPA: Uma2 family endonuclease [Kofleriaceae bacterium]|nr:Uma2 family endonuclease [Kofleriaceae bacterium]
MRLTAAEYLAWEQAQPVRYEIFDGDVFARPAESPRHDALCGRMIIALNEALRGRIYVGLIAARQLVLDKGMHYAYPDAGVVLGEAQLQAGPREVVANPSILAEVLSQGTERRDRGRKWLSYQRLPSLTDYVLVSQSEPRIEHFRRDGDRWSYRFFGPGERIELTGGAVLDVDAIFAGVLELPGD